VRRRITTAQWLAELERNFAPMLQMYERGIKEERTSLAKLAALGSICRDQVKNVEETAGAELGTRLRALADRFDAAAEQLQRKAAAPLRLLELAEAKQQFHLPKFRN
jgi:hypothetical protein